MKSRDKNVHSRIKELGDKDILFLLDSLKDREWDEKHFIREIALEVFGEDTAFHISILAIPLGIEMAHRFEKLQEKYNNETWDSGHKPFVDEWGESDWRDTGEMGG